MLPSLHQMSFLSSVFVKTRWKNRLGQHFGWPTFFCICDFFKALLFLMLHFSCYNDVNDFKYFGRISQKFGPRTEDTVPEKLF